MQWADMISTYINILVYIVDENLGALLGHLLPPDMADNHPHKLLSEGAPEQLYQVQPLYCLLMRMDRIRYSKQFLTYSIASNSTTTAGEALRGSTSCGQGRGGWRIIVLRL